MNSLDLLAFASLFRQACLKCFGHPLENPLTETESKLLYNRIFEHTGLTIGWKSLKNYSFFVLDGREENPSTATLDTLARYVLEAPYATEAERKEKEPHFPYWYRYKEQFVRQDKLAAGKTERIEDTGSGSTEAGRKEEGRGNRLVEWSGAKRRMGWWIGLAVVILLLTLFHRKGQSAGFTTNFHSVDEDSLAADGWFVQARDSAFWSRRDVYPGSLTFFTLRGDNWPDSAQPAMIRNLLLHPIPCDCWTLEVHLKDFIPRQNWQQAGILLLEDSSLGGKSMRISFAYNDYNGGYPRAGTILIQAITSPGNGLDKPEEIAHIVLLHTDSLDRNPLLLQDLAHTALRIERHGRRFRVLYADGFRENASFKEVVSHEFDMTPRYAGLFAIKGFVDSAADIPAQFRFFSLTCNTCGNP